MDDTEKKQKIIDNLNVGVIYHVMLLFVEQAFMLGKEESISSLSELFQKFMSSLSDKEKEDFSKKVKEMLDTKIEDIGFEMAEKFSPEELEAAKKDLGSLITMPSGAGNVEAVNTPAPAAPDPITPVAPEEDTTPSPQE